jgi:hypothetical protein
MVWLPAENSNLDVDNLAIQIETAARAMFQNGQPHHCVSPTAGNSVMAELANELIKNNSGSGSSDSSLNKNNNANSAKADTKE